MNKTILFFLLTLFMSSCLGDIEKDISTDLQFEGNEIFAVSFSLEESLFFPLQPFSYFLNTDSLQIPGCPQVFIDENLEKVTLNFTENEECTNSLFVTRLGKIHLQYFNYSVLESMVRVEFEDYSVDGKKIVGIREFKRSNSLLNPNRRTESFQDLLIINESNSSTRINGTNTYELAFENGIMTGFSSQGSIEGRNMAGRRIEMTQTSVKNFKTTCISNGFLLPQNGSENWRVFRNETQSTNHSLSYELEEECDSKATVTLDDGRIMVFRLTD